MTRCQKLSAMLLVTAAAAFTGASSVSALADNFQIGSLFHIGPIVNTNDGPVRGLTRNGVNIFLGIPYAAPPVGNLRWRPPAPPARHGLLDGTKYANTCAQVSELGVFAGPPSTTEDCLYLNVFTTGVWPPKPVLVWIHGGGNVDGESNDYDASKLAKNGIVVVTINYRMGLFGFLSEQHLNSEGHPSGNYGILDQQAALRWVKANIARFGGDPSKVGLGGQSAGSQDTTANLISPGAAGLFNRAITQSGPVAGSGLAGFTSAATALSLGNGFASAAGCSSAACLRNLTAEQILQLQGIPSANGPYVSGSPIVDGTIIPIDPATAWATGHYNKMPIIGGSTKDEMTFFTSIIEYFSAGVFFGVPPQAPLTAAQYAANLSLFFGANTGAVLAKYPVANYNNDPQLAYNRSVSDGVIKCPALKALKAQATTDTGYSVYGWDFTYQNAPYYFPKMPNPLSPTGNFQPLASHTIDIQFLFDKWHGGDQGVNRDQATGKPRDLQGAEITLSDQMVRSWTNFVKTGNPNGLGAPLWAVFPTSGQASFLKQDIPNGVETETQYRTAYKCDFWDSL